MNGERGWGGPVKGARGWSGPAKGGPVKGARRWGGPVNGVRGWGGPAKGKVLKATALASRFAAGSSAGESIAGRTGARGARAAASMLAALRP
jgi:hypothetical protein